MTAKKKQLKSLAIGRPPRMRPANTMSRRASRTLINKHHQLEKNKRFAEVKGDKAEASHIADEIRSLGGLARYQQASLQGQSTERGGDTSKVLLQWLPANMKGAGANQQLRMLEVGALSTKNACTNSKIFHVTHIDLNSQESGILQQDFMERPLPNDDSGRFDIISLSLVVNFVPDAAERGRMLRRTISFLRSYSSESGESSTNMFPSLFLVLPRSCVENSRYFTQTRLKSLMGTLGYIQMNGKSTQKLVYSLWKYDLSKKLPDNTFPKREVNPGRSRNNFVITLEKSQS